MNELEFISALAQGLCWGLVPLSWLHWILSHSCHPLPQRAEDKAAERAEGSSWVTVAPHVFQLLRGMTLPHQKASGKAPEEEEEESGDCDDEDDCGRGSGDGELRVRNQLRFLAGDGDGGIAATSVGYRFWWWCGELLSGVCSGSVAAGTPNALHSHGPEAADVQNCAGWPWCQSRQQLEKKCLHFSKLVL